MLKDKKHIVRIVLLTLIAALVLSSCGANTTDTSAGGTEESGTDISTDTGADSGNDGGAEAETEAEPASDGLITIRSYITGPLNSLDPTLNSEGNSLRMVAYTYEGLYKEGPDGQLVLGAASDVDVSEDGLTWTFTIRDDAYWSNGDPVTAYDFEFSWKRLANPDTGADYAYMLFSTNIVNAEAVVNGEADLDSLGIEATDEKTFVVHFTSPCSYFPNLAQQAFFAPINQSYFESQGDQFALSLENTIYNGQYIMTDWEVGGTYLKLEKNPNYYAADEVTTDVLEYRVITDAAQLVMAWESGEIDQIELTGDNVELYQNDPAYATAAGDFAYYLSFNTQVSGLDNVNLRKAISLTIDKQAICDYILKDGSIPMYYFVPEEFALNENGQTFRESANATYLETDQELAKEYWETAKEELGIDTLELNILYPEGTTTDLIVAEIQSELQNNLEGLTITLSVQPKAQVREECQAGNFEIGYSSWGADYEDPTTYLDLFTATSRYNYGQWQNERYNELYSLIYGEYAADPAQRLQALIEQESLLLEDAAICPIYQSAASYLLNTDYDFPLSAATRNYELQYATRK